MKYVIALCLALTSAALVHAGATLKEAREEWLQGDYAEAREMYESLAKNPKTRHAATLGLSLAWESQGRLDHASKVIESLLKETPKDADLLARQAELHYARGQFDQALTLAKSALEQNKDHFLGHWVLGQILRDVGDTAKAKEQFDWFIRASNTKDITDPDELRLAGLAGLERARLLHLTDEYQNVISGYFLAAVRADKNYWQGEYEAGRVFMDKHNKPAAFRAFDRALTINPAAAEVLLCKGQMAASVMEFKDAERFALQALKINPTLIGAINLMADVHWFSGEFDETLKTVAKAQAINPRDESTLARLAACHFAKVDDKGFQAIVKEAQKNNPKCYTFFSDLASLLEQRKFNGEAEKFYDIAIKMQPKFAEAQAGLGMLYMRMAKEPKARKILEEARDADPFNVRVDNSIKVLDHLDRYATKETEHFIIRFDKKHDVVLANFMAGYLEDIYKDLAEQFDYRPKGPFFIEIFSRHEMFSGRIVAVPDLHTIGACTGPLVAMVSPRDTSKTVKLFNWNRVIRHELVHVFNLDQTKARVPHWMTEGLAVRYEGPNIPPTWHALLAEKFNGNDLLNLDNILLGFIRPRSPDQWQQAYLQSLLYVEYLTKTYGEKSVGKMLAAFAEGLDTGPALEKACNVKQMDFEKGYREFLGEKVKKNAAGPPPKNLTLKQLQQEHAKKPDDLDITAQLAEMSQVKGKRKDAKELAEEVLGKDPKNVTAICVKANSLIGEGSPDVAYSLLDSINTDDLKSTKPLKLLAKLQISSKKFPQAVRTCERARKIDPHDPSWLKLLGELYVKTKQADKLLEVAEEVAKIDPDEITSRRALAKSFFEKGNNAEAEKYARMALEIDVLDSVCQQILLDALTAQNKMDEVDRLKKIFAL